MVTATTTPQKEVKEGEAETGKVRKGLPGGRDFMLYGASRQFQGTILRSGFLIHFYSPQPLLSLGCFSR